jgi:hypothetical protein
MNFMAVSFRVVLPIGNLPDIRRFHRLSCYLPWEKREMNTHLYLCDNPERVEALVGSASRKGVVPRAESPHGDTTNLFACCNPFRVEDVLYLSVSQGRPTTANPGLCAVHHVVVKKANAERYCGEEWNRQPFAGLYPRHLGRRAPPGFGEWPVGDRRSRQDTLKRVRHTMTRRSAQTGRRHAKACTPNEDLRQRLRRSRSTFFPAGQIAISSAKERTPM